MTKNSVDSYLFPAGGWGSVKSLATILGQEHIPIAGPLLLRKQNKVDGFMCVSCAWAKPHPPHPFEFCENGAKATVWEQTSKRVGPEFFEAHPVDELLGWSDHQLEEVGRLTHPLRYDAASDRYKPVSWEDAFAEIGRELRAMQPDEAVFYSSGRASLETSYMYALMARAFGTNNLPDSSNMCHETTSVALPQSIGVPVGTVLLKDFDETDLILFFGHNVGSNAPRMLHQLQEARKRDVPIITFNPLRERGLERFINPQSPTEMATLMSTQISTAYHQLHAGGDLAALTGICKALIALDQAARAAGEPPALDHAFIEEHTNGFEALAAFCDATEWANIERRSGLTREALEAVAAVYAKAEKVIGIYGMGLTQHRLGVETVRMLANLLLLRGNIGKPGAGICPVRGHSNVQGQRTVGITEKPELAPNDKYRELYGFEPPTKKGMPIVEACEAVLSGGVKAMISLGGNLIRAVPDTARIEPAWRTLRLTVNVSTKLNRSHLVPGAVSYILPCLGRIEVDVQETGPQAVSMEDSTGCFHGSRGMADPVSEHVRSEPWIVAQLAKAILPPNPRMDWDGWTADYARIRDAIEATYPEIFKDFNARLFEPGGMVRPLGARNRIWKTPSGKAEFATPPGLEPDPDMPIETHDALRLITIRSNGQFNTTIYREDDRFRGIKGTRKILFMNADDIARLGLEEGAAIVLSTVSHDGVERRSMELKVVTYDIPAGNCAGYYPELNVLLPLFHHDKQAKTPAAKSIPVKVERSQG